MGDIGPGVLPREWCANLTAALTGIPPEHNEERLRQFAAFWTEAQQRSGGSLNWALQLASRQELNDLLAALQTEPVAVQRKKRSGGMMKTDKSFWLEPLRLLLNSAADLPPPGSSCCYCWGPGGLRACDGAEDEAGNAVPCEQGNYVHHYCFIAVSCVFEEFDAGRRCRECARRQLVALCKKTPMAELFACLNKAGVNTKGNVSPCAHAQP